LIYTRRGYIDDAKSNEAVHVSPHAVLSAFLDLNPSRVFQAVDQQPPSPIWVTVLRKILLQYAVKFQSWLSVAECSRVNIRLLGHTIMRCSRLDHVLHVSAYTASHLESRTSVLICTKLSCESYDLDGVPSIWVKNFIWQRFDLFHRSQHMGSGVVFNC
jgi:hypothetical protein